VISRSPVNLSNPEPETIDVSPLRLNLLRAMYLLIAVGLGLTIWPLILSPPTPTPGPGSVVRALLGGLSLICVLGLRYPLQMLPILLFELLWKLIWVLLIALPAWLHGNWDDYAAETLFACLIGVVLVPLVLPWGHVWRHYVRKRAEPWRTVR
jgi:hypothetical protein